MGLETGNYISDLVASNPGGGDDRSQGDDHIRLVKHVLKTTFPNVNGPITVTDEQINQTASPGALCPPGIITMWSGSVASVPSGWKLCNGVGTISTGGPVPNLVDRFIIGSATNAGGNYNVGQTGGASTHSHVVLVAGHALTVDQIPSHTHGIRANTNSSGGYVFVDGSAEGGDESVINTYATGGSQSHTHGAGSGTTSHIPPYYALAFIIKN